MASGKKTGERHARVRDALLASLEKAAHHNRSDVVAPAAILWTDKERHWEKVVPELRKDAPILTLGEYAPESMTGPAIWLRCAIAGTLPDAGTGGDVPILYLPGVGKADLRAVEGCPKALQPLAELQYRGAMFAHPNGRDMTPAGLLSNALGVEVAGGRDAREALSRSLAHLMEDRVGDLRKSSPLQARDLDSLLVEDPERDMLLWLDDPDAYIEAKGSETSAAFGQVCKRDFGFDAASDGALHAARLLTEGGGLWKMVWQRFEEAPSLYPNIPALLDQTSGPSQGALFESASPFRPADNGAEEESLRAALLELRHATVPEARKRLAELEERHARRREWVWSKLGRSPLADALASLTELRGLTKHALSGDSPEEMAERYAESGWKADDAALRALASVASGKDAAAIKAAVLSVYAEWLEISARRFQKTVAENPIPTPKGVGAEGLEKGVCLLFVDGLRYDLAQRLAGLLAAAGNSVDVGWRFTALPGVTPTAKPMLSPAAPDIEAGDGFEARISESKVTAQSLRKAISGLGYEVLGPNEVGSAEGASWTEFGDIDSLGHERGWSLAPEVDRSLVSIAERVEELVGSGWREVRITTDHGWLMLPDGLPKAELPEHLTEMRKGRCARLKPGSSTSYQTVPWSLDPDVRVAVAPGIAVFQGTDEYEHGGLSLQECVVPILKVSPATGKAKVKIAEVKWTGLRCKVRVEGESEGVSVDLRTHAADSDTSLSASKKVRDGLASLPVEDDLMEGSAVLVVVVDGGGGVLAQYPTIVGG